MQKTILVKYGEIALKGKNRPFFEHALQANIADALEIETKDVRREHGRMYVSLEDVSSGQSKALEKVFGIVGFAEAVELPHEHDMDPIQGAVDELCSNQITEKHETFRIDTNRASKHFPLDSMEINKQLGAFVLEKISRLEVDLDHADFTVFVDVRPEGIFVYSSEDEHKGPGGLPVGVSGRGLLLLSGGIDSPVAGWAIMRRGMRVDAVYFDSPPYTGDQAKEKVRDLVRKLGAWSPESIRLYIPRFTHVMEEINKKCPEPTWTILHRRFMFRVAEQIATGYPLARHSEQSEESRKNNEILERAQGDKAIEYNALITGENLGQVASQTIENIAIINKVTDLPILRPLVGYDKEHIITKAREIESYRISNRPYEDCCTVFAPDKPKTRGREEEIAEAESALDVEALVSGVLNDIEIETIER